MSSEIPESKEEEDEAEFDVSLDLLTSKKSGTWSWVSLSSGYPSRNSSESLDISCVMAVKIVESGSFVTLIS